jgi:stage III sporulation protein AG
LEKLNIPALVKKYRYALIVLGFGVLLMLLPTGNRTEVQPQQTVAAQTPEMEERLARILSEIEGAGRVSVLLTQASGAETVYQTDENGDHRDTVIVSDAQRNDAGLIRRINPPVYQGAIVICQGGNRPAVRLAIVDAVSKVTGLGADQISVLKMK